MVNKIIDYCIKNKLNYYVENPKMSLIWKLIDRGIVNECDYGAYGFIYKKPTIFLSNKELKLKVSEKGKKYQSFEYASKIGEDRSKIPFELIKDIYIKLGD